MTDTKTAARQGPPPGPILVTGAGGCVGRALVDLLLARGATVRAVDRPGVKPSAPSGTGKLEWLSADLTSQAALAPLVKGTWAVIHLAAIVDIAVEFERLAPINWVAVKELYRAAAAAGVKRFVHFSTGSLYAPKADGSAWREDDPLWPQNDYARTKLLAEDFLRSESRGPGPRVTIVRPSLIFGPYGRALIASLAPSAEMFGQLPYLARLRGGPRTNLVHGKDMARAAIFLAEAEHADGEAFNVANKDVIDAGTMVHVAFRAAGASRPIFGIPYPTEVVRRLVPLIDRPLAFKVINAATEKLWAVHRWRHGKIAPHLSPRVDREALPFAATTAVFDVSKLERLGFTWEFPTFKAAWEDTVRWYRENGWLPPAVAA